MYRITLGMAKAVVAPTVNLCSTETTGRLTSLINRACERMLYGNQVIGSAKWQGTYGKYRVCLSGTSCLTWPRDISTIESWALDGTPFDIRNKFYEFLQTGPGLLSDCSGRGWGSGWQLIDDGENCAFDDVIGTGKKLAIYCDVTEDTNAVILRFYNDTTKEKVRSEYPSGTWIEGERIALPAAGNYALTTNDCMAGGLYQVIKPRTKGMVRLYEYDPATTTYRPLAYYEPNEEIPVYRRSKVPGLSQLTGTHTVTIIAKFQFIPAVSDNDFLQIPHMDAIRLGAQAVFREESNRLAEGAQYWAMAFACLQAQLAHHQGAGTNIPMKMVNASAWGGGIPTLH